MLIVCLGVSQLGRLPVPDAVQPGAEVVMERRELGPGGGAAGEGGGARGSQLRQRLVLRLTGRGGGKDLRYFMGDTQAQFKLD